MFYGRVSRGYNNFNNITRRRFDYNNNYGPDLFPKRAAAFSASPYRVKTMPVVLCRQRKPIFFDFNDEYKTFFFRPEFSVLLNCSVPFGFVGKITDARTSRVLTRRVLGLVR